MLAESLSFSCGELSSPMLVGGHGYEGSGAVHEGPFFSLYHHHRAWLRPMERAPETTDSRFSLGAFGWPPVSSWSPGRVLAQLPSQAVSS